MPFYIFQRPGIRAIDRETLYTPADNPWHAVRAPETERRGQLVGDTQVKCWNQREIPNHLCEEHLGELKQIIPRRIWRVMLMLEENYKRRHPDPSRHADEPRHLWSSATPCADR